MMNHDHEDYNNALINAFVFKHAVNIKRAYARTSWATDFMSLCCLKNNWLDWVWGDYRYVTFGYTSLNAEGISSQKENQ